MTVSPQKVKNGETLIQTASYPSLMMISMHLNHVIRLSH